MWSGEENLQAVEARPCLPAAVYLLVACSSLASLATDVPTAVEVTFAAEAVVDVAVTIVAARPAELIVVAMAVIAVASPEQVSVSSAACSLDQSRLVINRPRC